VELFITIVMLPTLYVFAARENDLLPAPETEFIEEGEQAGPA
jgi:hypothetical protein